jgi:hypothetical protein
MIRKRARTVWLVLTASALCACTGIQGDSDAAGSTMVSDDRYCEAMSHLVVLLEPQESATPNETQATFEEAAQWFAQAREAAPESISSDVAAYADAFEQYIRYLDGVDYRLEAVFESSDGSALAADTSHGMTPPIVDYVTDECGLTFGDET